MTTALTLHPDRLFPAEPSQRAVARRLYAEVTDLPSVSPHGHTDPRWFADDEPFADPASLLIVPDHYVYRMLYSQGVALEALGVPRLDGGPVERDGRKIWRAFAQNWCLFRGTPSRAWFEHSLHEDRLFPSDPAQRAVARRLYAEVKALPIVSPHGHTDPRWFADDEPFKDPASLLIIPDHYVYRMLYSQGVTLEAVGVPRLDGKPVEQDGRKIWRLFCENWRLFRGTPTRMWFTQELHDVFGIRDVPAPETADRIYDQLADCLRRPEYQASSLTGRVPALRHADFWLSESSAISEYLAERFPFPDFPRIFPADFRDRARARQLMAWFRSDLMPIREERPTTSVFYEPATRPLSPAGEKTAAHLLRVADALIQPGRTTLFDTWCIADADFALMLQRLARSGHPVPDKVRAYIDANWQRPTVRKWVEHERPAYVGY